MNYTIVKMLWRMIMAIQYTDSKLKLSENFTAKFKGSLQNIQENYRIEIGDDQQIKIPNKIDPNKINSFSKQLEKNIHYLEKIANKCYAMADETFGNDTTVLNHFAETNPIDEAVLHSKPSLFFKKAYTVQTFHENEVENINRDQPYINAGIKFSKYCETNHSTLDSKEKEFNELGTLISALNGAISQMNRELFAMKQFNEYHDELDDEIKRYNRFVKASKQEMQNDNQLSEIETLQSKIYEQCGNIKNKAELIDINLGAVDQFLSNLVTEIDKKPSIITKKIDFFTQLRNDIQKMIEEYRKMFSELFAPRPQSSTPQSTPPEDGAGIEMGKSQKL